MNDVKNIDICFAILCQKYTTPNGFFDFFVDGGCALTRAGVQCGGLPAAYSLRVSNDSNPCLESSVPYPEHVTDTPRWSGGLKTPLGGVPPPLVFEFGRFVAWKEVLKDCVVKLGGFFQVVGKAWVLTRSL